jgi:hypothetical protein
VLAFAGGWRIHDGRVERVSHDATSAAAPIVQTRSSPAPADQVTFVHHLSPSIPWPAWTGLVLLCLLPAVASMLAWSGSRRGRDSGFSGSEGAA